MNEWPVLYTAPMIRALLAGVKWQTRRPLYVLTKNARSAQVDPRYEPPMWQPPVGYTWTLSRWYKAAPGDLIWARENCWERPARTPQMMREGADTWEPFYYDADGISEQEAADFKAWGFKRRPSIHMPRAACRITRTITENRIERVQEISEADAIAEGALEWARGACAPDNPRCYTAVGYYSLLWEHINGAGSWDANPWVWVISALRIPVLKEA